jgi:hypothetical protein
MQTVKPDMTNQALENQEILQYLEGKLSTARKQDIDALAANDPFLADALEGLALIKDPIARANAIKDIQQNVFTKSGATRETRSIKLNYGAISGMAAVLVIAISSFFVIRHYAFQKDEKLAEVDKKTKTSETASGNTSTSSSSPDANQLTAKKEETPSSSIKKDSITNGTFASVWTKDENAAVADNVDHLDDQSNAETRNAAPVASGASSGIAPEADVLSSKAKSLKQGIIKGQVIDASTGAPVSGARVFVQGKKGTLTSNNGSYELTLDPGNYEIEYSQDGYEDQGKKVAVVANEQQPVKINVNLRKGFSGYTSNADKQEAATTSASTNTNDFKQGIDEYSKGQYKLARVTLDKAISTDPANIDAVYYAGLSYYNSYSPGRSIAYFDKVIKSGSKYREDAQWYKAQALMQKGMKEEAKKVLTDISSGKSKYKERAQKALSDY